jgi:hypothetical protein
MQRCESSHTSHFPEGGLVVFVVNEVFSPGKEYPVKDCLVLSLLARPSRCLKEWDLLYETVAVFSLPASSGGTILFAVFRLYKPQHVLAKYPPLIPR